MRILKKYFSKKEKNVDVSTTETSLITTTQEAVLVKGEKWFDIYEDGNGRFRAQYKDGNWLFTSLSLIYKYEYAEQFSTLETCQESAIHYINSRQLKKVGTIEFIPSKK